MITFNYHTHTCFCDGANTPMEMADAAYEKGFRYLGFSGHSYMSPEVSWSMAPGAEAYRRAIGAVQEAYAGRLQVFCGVEQDYWGEGDGSDFDYAIGSVHVLVKDGVSFGVDYSAPELRQPVQDLYGGNPYAMLRQYYEMLGEIPNRTAAKILGHFDLPTKFLEQDPLFDPECPQYLDLAYEAADKLIRAGMIFEINTGAMARSIRTSPYPRKNILEYICKQGGKVTVSSDSHSAQTIVFALEDAVKLAKNCGFSELWYFDGKNYLPTPIEA